MQFQMIHVSVIKLCIRVKNNRGSSVFYGILTLIHLHYSYFIFVLKTVCFHQDVFILFNIYKDILIKNNVKFKNI